VNTRRNKVCHQQGCEQCKAQADIEEHLGKNLQHLVNRVELIGYGMIDDIAFADVLVIVIAIADCTFNGGFVLRHRRNG
jgi:hypothetical protein